MIWFFLTWISKEHTCSLNPWMYNCISTDLCMWGSIFCNTSSSNYYYNNKARAYLCVFTLIWHCFKLFMLNNSFMYYNSVREVLLLSHFTDRKASFFQDHIAVKWQSLDSDSNCLSPELILLIIVTWCSFNPDIPSYLMNGTVIC